MKTYCTQNKGDCFSCSLSSYGKDCRNKPNSIIQQCRDELGISRAELARQAEIPIRTLENWELGYSKPSDAKGLLKIAKALNKSIEDLI